RPLLCTTSTCSASSSRNTSATGRWNSPLNTPLKCRRAPAGLVSGPSRFIIVRTPSSTRTGAAGFIALRCAWADRKPTPASQVRRGQGDPDAGRFEQVSAAARARRLTVAVFGDVRAGGRGHERGRGGNVEELGTAAAGAAGVHQVRHVHLHPRRQRAHGLDGAG